MHAHASFVDFPDRPRVKFVYQYRPRGTFGLTVQILWLKFCLDLLEAQGIIPLPPAASSSRTSRASSIDNQALQRKRSHSLINDEPYLKKRRVTGSEGKDQPPLPLEPTPSSPQPSTMAELYPDLYGDTLGDDLTALEVSNLYSVFWALLDFLAIGVQTKGVTVMRSLRRLGFIIQQAKGITIPATTIPSPSGPPENGTFILPLSSNILSLHFGLTWTVILSHSFDSSWYTTLFKFWVVLIPYRNTPSLFPINLLGVGESSDM